MSGPEAVGPALGGRLRALAREAGISQRDLAARSGVHEVSVSRIFRGQIDPQWSTVERLLRALGKSYRDLDS